MKIEIEIKDKPSSTKRKQDMVLDGLVGVIKKAIERNDDYAFSCAKRTYERYVDTLTGKLKRRDMSSSTRNEILNSIKQFTKKVTATDVLAVKPKNKYMDMMLNLYKVRNEQKPTMNFLGQWIGVEIECYMDFDREPLYDDDGDIVDTEDESYDEFISSLKSSIEKRKIKYVSIRQDGSIHPDYSDKQFGVEFTILTRIDDLSNLEKLCKFLNEKQAKVNSSCGLHIHLDQRDIIDNSKALSAKVSRFNRVMPLLTKLVPRSRLTSQFCSTKKSGLRNSSRYMAVNTQSLKKHSTIEIRLHSGTTDFIKISNWINLCYSVSNCSKIKNTDKHNIETVDKLKSYFGSDDKLMTSELYNYLSLRIQKFNPTTLIGPVDTRSIEQDEFRTDGQLQARLLPTEVNTVNVPF